MKMLPKTEYDPENPKPHESISDLPVHASTRKQIFWPTSESKHFTRADAAKVFNEKLLPADDRVPHPQLAEMHKDYKAGLPLVERQRRAAERAAEEETTRLRAMQRQAKKDAAVKVVKSGRWEFKISEINADLAGPNGRGRRAVGWRYGAPHMDRKRGTVKIPQSVE